MEKNNDLLKNALAKLPDYAPGENVWAPLSRNLDELHLQAALKKLPEYEPEEMLWDLIIKEPVVKKRPFFWPYAAAVLLLLGTAAVWLSQNSNGKQIAFKQEKLDGRLLANTAPVTDQQYQKLKAYCETETIVCTRKDYKQLQHEYERLAGAAAALREAIGNYNTEPELVRQYATIEQQKAEVLNEMAKMI